MTNSRAFVLGLAVGVAGALVPDLTTARTLFRDEPDRRAEVLLTWAAFLAVLLVLSHEVSANERGG